MTNETISAMIDAALDPLNAVQEQIQAALVQAHQYDFPRPFLRTIQGAVANLELTWETLNETATALDPHRGQPKH